MKVVLKINIKDMLVTMHQLLPIKIWHLFSIKQLKIKQVTNNNSNHMHKIIRKIKFNPILSNKMPIKVTIDHVQALVLEEVKIHNKCLLLHQVLTIWWSLKQQLQLIRKEMKTHDWVGQLFQNLFWKIQIQICVPNFVDPMNNLRNQVDLTLQQKLTNLHRILNQVIYQLINLHIMGIKRIVTNFVLCKLKDPLRTQNPILFDPNNTKIIMELWYNIKMEILLKTVTSIRELRYASETTLKLLILYKLILKRHSRNLIRCRNHSHRLKNLTIQITHKIMAIKIIKHNLQQTNKL